MPVLIGELRRWDEDEPVPAVLPTKSSGPADDREDDAAGDREDGAIGRGLAEGR